MIKQYAVYLNKAEEYECACRLVCCIQYLNILMGKSSSDPSLFTVLFMQFYVLEISHNLHHLTKVR